MTEFELHTLIMGGRAEFDLYTWAVCAVTFGFICIALGFGDRFSRGEARLLSAAYLLIALFFALRAISAIVRFGFLFALLDDIPLAFDPATVYLQIPTAIFRLVLFIALPIITIRLLMVRAQ